MVIAFETLSSNVVVHRVVPPVIAVNVPEDWVNEFELTWQKEGELAQKNKIRNEILRVNFCVMLIIAKLFVV